MEHYSALTRKEILTYATASMKLEDIMLREISQSRKNNYYMDVPMADSHWCLRENNKILYSNYPLIKK